MLNTRNVRLALAGIGLLVLLVVAWCGWTAWKVNRDLSDAVAHADAFQRAVEAGDNEAADRELTALEDSSGSAADRTDGGTWSVFAHLPVFGDDARGIRTASHVVHDLSQDGLEPLVDVQDQLDDLLPKEGQIPLDGIADLDAPVAQADAALQDAQTALDEQDTSGFAGRLEEKYADLEAKVSRASDAMRAARTALDILPSMLGGDGPRTYLLAFQNNAEIRATGGLPGTIGVIGADDGKVTLERQVPVAGLGRSAHEVLPLTDAEHKLFANIPGIYLQSSNMTPDVPRVADLMKARWNQDFPDEQVDGVMLVDTVTLSYVLEATGPITVDGIELTSDNVVDELLNNTYLRLPGDNKAQDAFFADVASTAFDTFANGTGNPSKLLSALAKATAESRIALHSFDPTEQEALAGSTIAGELVTDPDVEQPQVNVTFNDTTASKMSYYLRYQVQVDATYCQDGVQGFTGTAKVSSVAPRDAAHLPKDITGPNGFTDPGNQWVAMRIYGPVDGAVDDLAINAKPVKPIWVDQDGRRVAMFFIELKPGQTVDVEWTMESGSGQTGDAHLAVTPSVEPGQQGGSVASAC